LVIARLAVSISGQILRHLSILAAQLNISARVAISEAMTELINAVIASTLKYVQARSDHTP
jgi:hypothetical protein